jgi:predicted anti-sigma-YlaC factor YlaD
VPLLAVFVLALTGLSALDLVTGEVGWQRLASHLPAATGLLLTGVLARLHPAPDPVPGHTSGAGPARSDDHRWDTVVDHRPRSGHRPPAVREPAA